MVTPILDQNRAYRKGLILGFTMAEISVLIIFCLLLATSFLIDKKNNLISQLSHENEVLNQVKEKLDNLKKQSPSGMKFDDLFQELVRSKEQEEKINALQTELNNHINEIRELEDIKSTLNTDTSNKPVQEVISELVENSEFGKEIKDFLESHSLKDLSAKEIIQIINPSKDPSQSTEKMEALVEVTRLKGQLANAQSKLERLGKGTEMPACWADPETGKPEYIFKIDLTSDGLIIHNENIPNRVNEQKLLPLNMIHFDKNISRQDFITQTFPLYQWSVRNNCRFFVIAKDKTADDQKNTYKTMLHSLESHFYKLEQ